MIIAQEILHSMEKKKGRVGTMALKIDLEKAFDCLEWEVLVPFNFPLISLPSSWIVFHQPLFLCFLMVVSSLLLVHPVISGKETRYHHTFLLCVLNILGFLFMIKLQIILGSPSKLLGSGQPSPIHSLPMT